jgi:hypothetical protein
MKFVILSFALILLNGCSTGVDNSIKPGILKLFIEVDTSGFIISRDDSLIIMISQKRAYREDGTYANIYKTLSSLYMIRDTLNLFDLDKNLLSESYLPPGNFTKIMLVVSSSNYIKINGKRFHLQQDTSSTSVQIKHRFKIFKNMVTEITLRFKLSRSLFRRSNVYIFKPVIEVG